MTEGQDETHLRSPAALLSFVPPLQVASSDTSCSTARSHHCIVPRAAYVPDIQSRPVRACARVRVPVCQTNGYVSKLQAPTYPRTRVYLCMRTHARTHACTRARTHTHTHTHAHAHAQTHAPGIVRRLRILVSTWVFGECIRDVSILVNWLVKESFSTAHAAT